MSAEILQFPDRGRQIRLSVGLASLDDLIGEIESLATRAEQESDLHSLLKLMEKLSECLMDLGYLLLGGEAMLRSETAFDTLSAMIGQTRKALDELDGRASPWVP